MKPELLCLLQQPTQFDPPLWRALERRGRYHPVVWYSRVAHDKEIGRDIAWGHDLTGLDYQIVARDDFATKLRARERTPAAVICERWTLRSTWAVGWQCFKRGTPAILPSDRIPDPQEPLLRSVARRTARLAANPIFKGHLTTGVLGTQSLRADGVSEGRIARAWYPIDVDLFQSRLREQQQSTRKLKSMWPDAGAIVLAVAKHVERESPLLILDTFKALQGLMPDAKLIFVGDGPMRAAVEAHIANLKLGDAVYLPGYVPYENLAGYYGAADVFLHVAAFGPWEISVSEAMACGVPAVTTSNIGCAADLIVPGSTGAVAAVAKADVLAFKLLEVLSFPEREAIRNAVIRRARTIDVSRAAENLERLLDALYGRR